MGSPLDGATLDRVADALTDTPVTAVYLARTTGLSFDTVNTALAWLADSSVAFADKRSGQRKYRRFEFDDQPRTLR